MLRVEHGNCVRNSSVSRAVTLGLVVSFIGPAICACVLVAASGLDALPCLHQSALTQAMHTSRQIIKVAEFGGSGRKTAEEYAKIHNTTVKQIEARYASSGELACGPRSSGAELVQTNSTVVVAMHALFKDRTCELKVPLSECKIRLKKDGKNQFFGAAKILATGLPCPHSRQAKDEEDWAILKLDGDAQGFKPYKARDPKTLTSSNVIGVGQSIDFYQPNGDKRYYPMHYSDCRLMDSKYHGMLGTTCGGSGRTSGSGLFDDNIQDPHIVGVYLGSSETAEIEADELAKHRVENRPYNADNWTSTYVPVNGSLARALSELGRPDSTGPIEPKPALPPDDGSGTEL